MTGNVIILPVLVHMVIAVILIFLWKKVLIRQFISVIGNIIVVAIAIMLFSKVYSSGIITMQAGNWKAPFGITFVADLFSCTMVLLTSIAGLAVSIYSTVGISKARMRFGYFAILHFLLMGLNGAFLTGDIFNLYVWFEIIIISSFVLMTLGGKKPQLEGAINYVTLNLLASIIFLTATGILYGLTGSLNMADLSIKVAEVQNRGLVNVTALLFFVGFGIKSAVFPLYFWLPSSYHTPPSAIAAIFAGLLTKVGVYALLRVFTLIFVPDDFIKFTMLSVAVATLLTGAFGAIVKDDIRKIFSYLIVCHIGYMIAGLGMFTQVAIAGAIFYLVHDILIKTNLFLAIGILYKIKGTVRLKQLSGLYEDYPRLSLLMAILFFSLVGVPPLSGFWAKIQLYKAGFETESYITIAAIILASFVTLFVIAKIWIEAFWKTAPVKVNNYNDDFADMQPTGRLLLMTPIVILTALILYVGFFANDIMIIANRIAVDLLNPSSYIKAVLGTI